MLLTKKKKIRDTNILTDKRKSYIYIHIYVLLCFYSILNLKCLTDTHFYLTARLKSIPNSLLGFNPNE